MVRQKLIGSFHDPSALRVKGLDKVVGVVRSIDLVPADYVPRPYQCNKKKFCLQKDFEYA
jgi:hypothetical protein